MFIEAFHYSEDAGNILEVYLTNLKIARQRIIEFKLQREPQSFSDEKQLETIIYKTDCSPKAEESKDKKQEGDEFSSDEENRMDYMLSNLEHHQSAYINRRITR